MRFRFLVLPLAALLSGLSTARADENIFGYTYGAETLPAGKSEIYTWQTFRFGKVAGSYLGWDQKYEYEVGLTDKLQLSLYADFNHVDISGVPGFDDRKSSGFWGAQAALKYNVLSPFKDPVGLSLYIEPGYFVRDERTGESGDAFELETMIILQKNFLDDTVMWYTNVFTEFEWAKGGGGWEFEGWGPTVFSGVAWRFAPRWYIGVEGHVDADFEGAQWNREQHWDVFAGPVLHYGDQRWWATVSVQKNLASSPASAGSSRNLDDHEDFEVRLKAGFNF